MTRDNLRQTEVANFEVVLFKIILTKLHYIFGGVCSGKNDIIDAKSSFI